MGLRPLFFTHLAASVTNDLLEFDPVSLAWSTLDPGSGVAGGGFPPPFSGTSTGSLPAARTQAAFFGAGGGLFVFGGIGIPPFFGPASSGEEIGKWREGVGGLKADVYE